MGTAGLRPFTPRPGNTPTPPYSLMQTETT